jgi:hypothetical protein
VGLIAFHRTIADKLDPVFAAQAQFLDSLKGRTATLALIVITGPSLYMELAMIRWLAAAYPFFSFYKNYSLLACFLGLGAGHALADDERITLPVTLPLSL